MCWAVPCWLLRVCWVGNFCWGIHDFWLVIRYHDVTPCWPVTCWPVICWAVTCWAVHSICLTRHCCRVVHFCWNRHTCLFVNAFWSGQRWNHSDGSSLWRLGNRRGQLYLPSGDVGRTRPLRTFMSSMFLMMTRRGPVIYGGPRWWRRQGPTITRWLVMMVMRMSGRPWRTDIRRLRWDTARPQSTRRVSLPPGAGPTRWRGPSPLPTLSTSTVVSGWMMGPRWVMVSVRPVRSSTALLTPWSVAFWPLGPGNTVGPGPSHHGHAGGHRLLLFTGPGRPAGRVCLHIALDPDHVAVFALFFLDDPSLLRLTGGSWRASSGAFISTESSIASLSWDFLATFAAAAALRLRFCSMAFSWACHASGNQFLQTSQGESLVHSIRPSLRRHCWQW